MLFGQEAGAYSNCRMYRTGAIATTRASFQWQRCAKKTGLLTSALSRALKLIGHEDCVGAHLVPMKNVPTSEELSRIIFKSYAASIPTIIDFTRASQHVPMRSYVNKAWQPRKAALLIAALGQSAKDPCALIMFHTMADLATIARGLHKNH